MSRKRCGSSPARVARIRRGARNRVRKGLVAAPVMPQPDDMRAGRAHAAVIRPGAPAHDAKRRTDPGEGRMEVPEPGGIAIVELGRCL